MRSEGNSSKRNAKIRLRDKIRIAFKLIRKYVKLSNIFTILQLLSLVSVANFLNNETKDLNQGVKIPVRCLSDTRNRLSNLETVHTRQPG